MHSWFVDDWSNLVHTDPPFPHSCDVQFERLAVVDKPLRILVRAANALGHAVGISPASFILVRRIPHCILHPAAATQRGPPASPANEAASENDTI